MIQSEINQQEWNEEDNWLNPKFLGIYASPRDSRVWVPKRNPALGWTLNFGHPQAMLWVLGFIGFVVLVAGIGWYFGQDK